MSAPKTQPPLTPDGPSHASAAEPERIAAVREFNRFYTNVIGVLRGGLLDTPYSLTEARVIFELAQRDVTDVADLRRSLDIDAGYLSRILSRFEAEGVVARDRSTTDARRQVIRLTDAGRSTFTTLDERAAAQVRDLIGPLDQGDRAGLVAAMASIRNVLATADREGVLREAQRSSASAASRPAPIVIRDPRPGEYGWVVERHGAIYAHEYRWNEEFEALVARIVADFLGAHDPKRERAWIADSNGRPIGCVFCVRRDDTTAQLRLLLVEPDARGAGLGSRLVDECIRFARQAGYRDMMLWTNDVLVDARRIYERAGFVLAEEAPHHSFGHDLVEQIWRRAL